MGITLYILRQQPGVISPALFRQGEADTEVVLIEGVAIMSSSLINGSLVPNEKVTEGDSIPISTYDDLIMKIFSFDHTVVL